MFTVTGSSYTTSFLWIFLERILIRFIMMMAPVNDVLSNFISDQNFDMSNCQ